MAAGLVLTKMSSDKVLQRKGTHGIVYVTWKLAWEKYYLVLKSLVLLYSIAYVMLQKLRAKRSSAILSDGMNITKIFFYLSIKL